MSKVITVPVTTFTSHDKLAQTLNEAVADKNVQGIFFNKTSLLSGQFEILIDTPKVITVEKPVFHEVEKIIEVEKCIEKEVPLKIVNQVKKRRGSSSQYRGVCRKGEKWYAMLQYNHKKHWCGSHLHEMAAAEAYDRKAIELMGAKAVDVMNFPDNYKEVTN